MCGAHGAAKGGIITTWIYAERLLREFASR
jgi:hypothetical protein